MILIRVNQGCLLASSYAVQATPLYPYIAVILMSQWLIPQLDRCQPNLAIGLSETQTLNQQP